ncbi:cupredoxin domain-containing protein [Candidatus Kaiserbacteria bacterium]|nr:cupredoxin domain-containing protein [Candidatus Kaiserbacteria bacterium]
MKILLGIVGLIIIVGLVVYLTKDPLTVIPDEQNTVTDAPASGTQAPVAETTETPQATTTQPTAGTATSTASDDVLAVTVHAASYAFTPQTITAKLGQKVRMTVVSDGGLHDFVIDEFAGAKTARLQSGKNETIEFTADKKGSFTYYCSVGNHRAMGMEGTLTVE